MIVEYHLPLIILQPTNTVASTYATKGITSAYFPLIKFKGKTFPKQHQKIMNINIFCSPEEAMLDNWQKLDFNTKYFVLREI